jgi:hypothetical protein
LTSVRVGPTPAPNRSTRLWSVREGRKEEGLLVPVEDDSHIRASDESILSIWSAFDLLNLSEMPSPSLDQLVRINKVIEGEGHAFIDLDLFRVLS